jgi:hypothetical protein
MHHRQKPLQNILIKKISNILVCLNPKSRYLIMAATSICLFNHKHVQCICINANHGSVALFTDPLLCSNDRIHNYNHMFTSCIHIITPSVALEPMTRVAPCPLVLN